MLADARAHRTSLVSRSFVVGSAALRSVAGACDDGCRVRTSCARNYHACTRQQGSRHSYFQLDSPRKRALIERPAKMYCVAATPTTTRQPSSCASFLTISPPINGQLSRMQRDDRLYSPICKPPKSQLAPSSINCQQIRVNCQQIRGNDILHGIIICDRDQFDTAVCPWAATVSLGQEPLVLRLPQSLCALPAVAIRSYKLVCNAQLGFSLRCLLFRLSHLSCSVTPSRP